jgi:hypothetical protein
MAIAVKTNGAADKGQRLAQAEPVVGEDARAILDAALPYRMRIGIVGQSAMLLHAWDATPPENRPTPPKGGKKTDNVESYCYRDPDGYLGVPGANFAACVAQAGRFMKDPRSPRKSALDICKAGIVPLTEIATFEPRTQRWDYDDARRVTVQRAGITRVRPGMHAGWRLEFDVLVLLPEYFPPHVTLHLASEAGRLVGLCDYRPVYGRFSITSSEVLAP